MRGLAILAVAFVGTLGQDIDELFSLIQSILSAFKPPPAASVAPLSLPLLDIPIINQGEEPADNPEYVESVRQFFEVRDTTKPGVQKDDASSKCCPNGWLVFDSNCYYFSDALLEHSEALNRCRQFSAELWVPDTKPEFVTIKRFSKRASWSWIGVRGEGGENITYITDGGMDPEELPWLVKSEGHGLNKVIDCVAFYNAPILIAEHVNWSPCALPHFYICEYNTTAKATY